MTTLFGLVGINETQYDFVARIGQEIVYEATRMYLERANNEMTLAMQAFVDPTPTTNIIERFNLVVGGGWQTSGTGDRSAAVKPTGFWDVGFPLNDRKNSLRLTDVTFGAMTPQRYQQHIDTILQGAVQMARRDIVGRLMNNTAYTFNDPLNVTPTVTVQPLANQDGTLYPGTISDPEVASQRNRYYGLNYTAITATDNPFARAFGELEDDFGFLTGGAEVYSFINKAQQAAVEALPSFVPVVSNAVSPGQDTNIVIGIPDLPAQIGKVIGTVSGCYVIVWGAVPSGYLLHIRADAEKPLKMRVDPQGMGIPQGIHLVVNRTDFPLLDSEWRWRYGVGTYNRLNGVVQQLVGSTSYTVPTAYSGIGF